MNLFYIIYIVITTVAFVVISPFLLLYALVSGWSLKGINERLGWISQKDADLSAGSPRIWIHAVSLGEVRAAEAIACDLKRMIPGGSITISTMTGHGRSLASEIFGRDVRVIYAPFDIFFFVRLALDRVRPDILVFLETELWPAWATEARRKGIKTAVVNGRISPRSFGRYLRLRPLFKYILSKFDAFSMISEEDKKRIIAMGAHPAKVSVNGNAKFDLLKGLAEPSAEADMRRLFNLDATAPVLIAGSTRTGEEEIVINAYRKITGEFPDTVLFIAPRHIERAGDIAALLEKNRLEYQFRSEFKDPSEKRNRKVVIIDSFGELFRLYSIGTVVFSGASLVPLGGQNPLEAAIWAKPVLYGPSMEDFLDARALLEENNAGIEVADADMLAEKVIMLLRDKTLREGYGSRAREAVLKNRRAAERHSRIIADILIGTD